MNQDMDENSLLDQPSDIDELEKAKAIESIVLNSGKNYSSTFDEDDVNDNTDGGEDSYEMVENDDDDIDEDDDMTETDTSMVHTADRSSIVNVTNSMYDESLERKSTDAENGSESCMETKEMDLDSMDGERSTNIVASEPTSNAAEHHSKSPSPSPPLPTPLQPRSVTPHQEPTVETRPVTPEILPLPIEQPIVSSSSTDSTTATAPSSSSSTSPQQQTSNKLCFYVKVVPKASSTQPQSQPQAIVMTVPKSPPKIVAPIKATVISTSLPTKPGTVEAKQSEPLDNRAEKESTTSTINSSVASLPPPVTAPSSSSSSKSIGHTVNLLNNNRILIKKNLYQKHHHHGHHRSKSTVTDSNDTNETHTSSDSSTHNPIAIQKKDGDAVVDTKSDIAICGVNENVKHDGADVGESVTKQTNKCETNNADNGSTSKALEIKREQLLNENSMDGDDDDDDDDIDNNDENDDDNDNDSKDTKHFVNDTTDTNDTIAALATAIIEEKSKIKREYEQLAKTVNQSKVLSEFVIEHNKRNRRPTKSGKSKHWKHNNQASNPSVDNSFDVKMDRCSSPSTNSVRSASKESDRSSVATSSSANYGGGGATAITAASATAAGKRNTRSQNTDFSAKQKRFLKGIQQITRGTDDETDNQSDMAYDDDDDDVDYLSSKKQSHITERRKSTYVKTFNLETKSGWDKYCWRCHLQETNLYCSCCIRSYHANCLKMKVLTPNEMHKWQCPECMEIKLAEKENKKKKFDVKHFNKLLKYAMNRILQDPNLQQFQFPVNKTQNPGYSDIIVHPINLSKIESKIDNLVYTNSEAFLSDIKWILHNCSIYFSDNYKVTRAAKTLQKVSKQEVGDIETCAECYLNANTMTDNWFTEVCAKPHLILWAKLKGFPYWPAKAMSINSTLVDVRFFGEHDRANIPSKDCYLYSREDPNPPTNKYKRNTIADCVKEVDIYIENIKEKYGSFNYAELKTPFNPQTAEQHLHQMIPGLRSTRGRRRSSIARSDLTLKIVKTADNHLSVVKKEPASASTTPTTTNTGGGSSTNSLSIKQDQLPPPPQIKRTVDITGDGVVSRTPTPPSAILARRKTSDTRYKRSKSNVTNRHSDGGVLVGAGKVSGNTLNAKSYQVQRRKSMAVEKLDQKRVNVIQANLDLNSSNESTSTVPPSTPDASFVSQNAKNETEIGAKRQPNSSSTKSQLKKRKLSIDTQETPGEKMVKRDTSNSVTKKDEATSSTASRTISADKSIPDDANILSSVGLMRKTTATQPAPKKRTDAQVTPAGAGSGARGRPPKTQTKATPTTKTTCDTTNDEISNDSTAAAAARTRTDRANSQEDDSGGNGSALVLVPFLEVKKENDNDSIAPPTTTGKIDPSASPILVTIPSSSENTPAKNDNGGNAEDNLSIVKTETSSDDDSLMIIDDDLDNNSSSVSLINAAKKQTAAIDELLERRGIITVRDLSKMTGKNPMPSARKSFPKGPSAGSILKPRNLTASQQQITATKPPMNNMVSIPLDGLPRMDVIYNSTQPPPLSVVGSGNSVSLLAQNQSTSTSTSTSAAAVTSTSATVSQAISNGPPPLSITTIPTVVSVASLLSTATSASATNTASAPSSSLSSSSSATTQHHNNISHLMTNLSNGTITEQMASTFTDMLVRPNPPALTARPTAPLRSDGDTVFPSEAGSASKTLVNNSHKMSDFFRTVIEDTIGDLAVKHPEARVVMLELELEKERILRQKEVTDLKANFERVLTEMKKSMEKDRQRVINDIRKQCELERIRSIEDAKRKQWCANCLGEAQFYCCWNTSYCNHVCQRKHWDQHMSTCAQLDSAQANVQNMRRSSNVKAQPKGELRSQSVNVQQKLQSQPQIQTKVTQQLSGQKDTNPILAGTRSATRIAANNSTTIPALRNILPKNAVVSMNSSSPQQRHQFNQNIQGIKPSSNQQPCIIVANRTWPAGTAASKSATSLLHSNAIYLPSSQFATIANVAPNSGGSSSGVSLLSTSQSQKSIANETIIIP